MPILRLYAMGERLGDNEFVVVDEGSEAEALWRSHGYLPEGEEAERAATSTTEEIKPQDHESSTQDKAQESDPDGSHAEGENDRKQEESRRRPGRPRVRG